MASLDEGCIHLLTDLRLLSVRIQGMQLIFNISLGDVYGVQLVDDTNSVLLTLAPPQNTVSTVSANPSDLSVRAVMCVDQPSARSLHKNIVHLISYDT